MESIIAEYKRLSDVKDQTIRAMQVVTDVATTRAEKAEKRADREHWLAILGPVGLALGLLLHF